MGFGKHWEWRGFGEISAALSSRLEALPLKYPQCQELTDEYLWVPNSPVNVKLRFSDLKFKRLIETAQGLERWLEDPAENYALPVAPEVLTKLSRDLQIELPPLPATPLNRDQLVRLLALALPQVRLVAVEKSRWQREWLDPESESSDNAVTVEVARILAPEATWSVGLEHPRAECVQRAQAALGLNGVLRKLNYLEALALWAEGKALPRP